MQAGRVVGTLAFTGEEKLAVNIPGTGKPSDSIAELKKQVVGYLNQHAASNLATDEVEMLEEQVSDDENASAKKKKGQKRKR